MKVVGFYGKDKERDRDLVKAVIDGARRRGERAKAYSTDDYPEDVDCDAVVIFGIKGRRRYDSYRKAGVKTVYLDKGYDRRVEFFAGGTRKRMVYWRVAVNAHHPTKYLGRMKSPPDRWDALGLPMLPWRSGGDIILAGSSGKFHDFRGLENPNEYAAKIVEEIRRHTGRRIIYRAKPSWKEAAPVVGADFSDPEESIVKVLEHAHALVTYGSNACFEAMMYGVPCIILGDAVARPISSTTIDAVENPRLASDAERRQLLSDLAYAQWSLREHATGAAWPHIRRYL